MIVVQNKEKQIMKREFHFKPFRKEIAVTLVSFLVMTSLFSQDRPFIQHLLSRQLDKNAKPNSGPAPDYSNLYYWAASPHKQDMSDSIPDFLKAEERTEDADVLFIHPTTYINPEENVSLTDPDFNRKEFFESVKYLPWNADLRDNHINERTDTRVIFNQATVFNGSCRIYAPRYRQANIKAFIVPQSEPAHKAFELAYRDIKAAFEYYLKYENKGRPIIIAGHSQGTLHAIHLLQDYFDGKPLQSQLVCAYLVGHQIAKNAFKTIRLSTTLNDIGGFVGWRSYKKGELPDAIAKERGNSQCINPLTWTASTDMASKKNENIVLNGKAIDYKQMNTSVDADAKILWVSWSSTMQKNNMEKTKNLHIFDYNLFWMEIRHNLKERIEAYKTLHAK